MIFVSRLTGYGNGHWNLNFALITGQFHSCLERDHQRDFLTRHGILSKVFSFLCIKYHLENILLIRKEKEKVKKKSAGEIAQR